MHVALHGNFSGQVSATDLVEVSKDAASLLVCTQKIFFDWGMRIFCEWRHKWKTLGRLGPLYLALGANR